MIKIFLLTYTKETLYISDLDWAISNIYSHITFRRIVYNLYK
jgi:hypothetical protein